jgi:hypothetical protein
MKLGLRKRLQMDKISYDIAESDLHIVIRNKILIQIYNPKYFNSKKLATEIDDFRQISSLFIMIFDFIDYNESIEGEKRLVKRKLQEFAKEHKIQAISVDNEEELYFIIENLLNSNKRYQNGM